ncbi:Unknown protein [Striga hermonthica]|uniref:Uncharacterized protein n=1 Tax=Striga hermonthica TaxID=68872 RepID=A0A9N7N5G3_STRHE|nr:Unknown protein [Striga hermonthica]
MAITSYSSFSYQKLKPEVLLDDDESRIWEEVVGRSLIRRSRFSGVRIRRRFRVKIPRIKRLMMSRKASFVKIAWIKVCKRLKESRAHFGDLFAGNYMFMQVSPAPLN